MTDEQRDARARDTAAPDLGIEEMVEAELVEDEQSSAGPDTPESPENGAADRVERDLDDLAAAERERDEYLELAKRTKADFENYRKRVARETRARQLRAGPRDWV